MHIIPLSSQIEAHSGEFHLTAETVILSDFPNRWNADFLRSWLAAPTGFPLPVRAFHQAGKNSICLRLQPGLESLGREGYRLAISSKEINREFLQKIPDFAAFQPGHFPHFRREVWPLRRNHPWPGQRQ